MIPTSLLPEEYRYSWVIAGGWAVCPALATDKDVWVMVDSDADLVEERDKLLAHLTAEGYDFVAEESDPSTSATHSYYTVFHTLKVALVRDATPIHLLITTADDIEEVLNSFDLSISQVGISPQGYVVRGEHWTPPADYPIVLKNTPTTFDRLQKYVDRFHITEKE